MTQLIAMMAGPYLAVTGLGFLLSTGFYVKMIAGSRETDRVTLNLSGAVHFLVGLLVLVQHFRWDGPAEIAVTLVGAAAALKGAALIAVPEMTLSSPMTSPAVLRVSGTVFLALGGYLGYAGFLGSAG